MKTFVIASALLCLVVAPALPQSVAAQQTASQKPLSLEHRTLLRCSAAFAMVGHGQSIGNQDALQWPALEKRGKEFFVRALAKLIDETGRSRSEISQLVEAEAQQLWDTGTVNDVMPGCLLMLETSDL